MTPTIDHVARQCSELFDRILRSTNNQSPHFLLTEELRGRFSLWAAYVGVFAAPRASLDARLDGHKKIKDMVLELVEMVQRNLEWEFSFGLQDVAHNSDKKAINGGRTTIIPTKDTSETQEPIEAVDENNGDDPLMAGPGLDAIEAAIDRLLILAVAIRRSARRDHSLRRGDHQAQAELMCCLLVKARYPNARRSLCNQLAASIHIRGASLHYLKMHNKKLAFVGNDQGPVEDPVKEEVAAEGDYQEPENHADHLYVFDPSNTSAPETLPSDLSPSVFSQNRKVRNKPSGSILSRGWTVQDGQEECFYYPSIPAMTNSTKYRSCNLCGDPLEESFLTQEFWEAHVEQDLQPYVCISEECREPPRYFVRRRDWLSHMQSRHSMAWAEKVHTEQWYCDLCDNNTPEFEEKNSFVAHLNTQHGTKLTKPKIDGRVRRNRRIATREPLICPICGCVPDGLEPRVKESLWNHIAAHLRSISFLSLSYVEDDPGDRESIFEVSDNDEKDDASISRTSLWNRNHELLLFDDIPTTHVLGNGLRIVDGQEFPGEPILLDPQQTLEFERVRLDLQGFMNPEESATQQPNIIDNQQHDNFEPPPVPESEASVKALRSSISHSTLAVNNEETGYTVFSDTYSHELVYKDGQIMGGSLRALVEKLTHHQSTPDAMFVSTFYFTFRLFATPLELAEVLVDRFDNIGNNPQAAGPVRLRVYNVFKRWLESHWRHDQDSHALDFIVTFARTRLSATLPTASRRILDIADMVSTLRGPFFPRLASSMSNTNNAVPPPVLSRKEINLLMKWKNSEASISILDFNPLELARQLTIMESRIFCSILPEELLDTEWMRKTGSIAVNVRAMSTLSTDLAHLVADSILSHDDPRKRAGTIKHWVKVANKCLELNNYDSLMAIICSLNSSMISRLKRTWAMVSQKTKTSIEHLRSIVDVSRNYAVLRQRLKNHALPCLPFIGTYLTDLTFADHGNQLFRTIPTDKGAMSVINFEKHVKTTRIIMELQRFQVPYHLAEVPDLQTWLQQEMGRVRSNGERSLQTFYGRSLVLEPRETSRNGPSLQDQGQSRARRQVGSQCQQQ